MRPVASLLLLIAVLMACGFRRASAAAGPQGRALLKEFCASCHAIGKTDRSRHAGAPPFRTLGRSFDLDEFPRLLERGISSDHPDMPEFKFSEDDANAVRAYLRTIQQ